MKNASVLLEAFIYLYSSGIGVAFGKGAFICESSWSVFGFSSQSGSTGVDSGTGTGVGA